LLSEYDSGVKIQRLVPDRICALRSSFRFTQAGGSAKFVEQMPEAEIGMSVQHPRTGITHHCLYLLTFLICVAVHLTVITSRFGLLERAGIQTAFGIFQQEGAIVTQPLWGLMMIPTVDVQHGLDGPFFPLDAVSRIDRRLL
jgi:hypothetical protein